MQPVKKVISTIVHREEKERILDTRTPPLELPLYHCTESLYMSLHVALYSRHCTHGWF